jgi:hypothetical protein
MPHIFRSPGSFNQSARRNGLALHPEEHLRRFEHEASLFRATNVDAVPVERLGVRERVLRRQFEIAARAGEVAVEAGSYDLPVTPVLDMQDIVMLRAS